MFERMEKEKNIFINHNKKCVKTNENDKYIKVVNRFCLDDIPGIDWYKKSYKFMNTILDQSYNLFSLRSFIKYFFLRIAHMVAL